MSQTFSATYTPFKSVGLLFLIAVSNLFLPFQGLRDYLIFSLTGFNNFLLRVCFDPGGVGAQDQGRICAKVKTQYYPKTGCFEAKIVPKTGYYTEVIIRHYICFMYQRDSLKAWYR